MKNLKNFIVNELYGSAWFILISGIIYSFVVATETYTSWGETVTKLDGKLLMKYLFATIITYSILIGIGAIVQYLFNIQETLHSMANLQTVAKLQREKLQKTLENKSLIHENKTSNDRDSKNTSQ